MCGSVLGVADMSDVMADAKWFEGDISKWNVHAATDMRSMFFMAEAFNGDISRWDVSQVSE